MVGLPRRLSGKNLPSMLEMQVLSWVGKIPSSIQKIQYSYLENPMDRRAWWATVCGVARVRSDLAAEHCIADGMVKTFIHKHGRVSGMEGKSRKATVLITSSKSFLPKKTVLTAGVIGQKLNTYHYPVDEKPMHFPFRHPALPTWPFKDSPLISMRRTKITIKTMKGMLHTHWSVWDELQDSKSSKWTSAPSYCDSRLFKDISIWKG